jgi:hypothetical protein
MVRAVGLEPTLLSEPDFESLLKRVEAAIGLINIANFSTSGKCENECAKIHPLNLGSEGS